jgi:flagellar FliL protein
MSETPAVPAKGQSSKKLIPIVAAVLLVVAGGGGYFWYAKQAAAAAAAEAEAEDEDGDDAEADDAEADDEDHGAAKKKKKKKAKKKKAKKGRTEHMTLMSFDPFVVNLADPNAARFLRTNVQLVVAGEGGEGGGAGHGGGAAGPSVETMRARSAILELLSAQMSDHLTTVEGKAELKAHIIERMEEVLEGTKVEDVLFSDFVIQF